MAETNDAITVPKNWVSLSFLTGYSSQTELIVQNVGYPGDVIDVAFSDTEPSSEFKGLSIDQIKQYYQLPKTEFNVWVRYRRLDGVENYRDGLLSVQQFTSITPYTAIAPASSLTNDGLDGYRIRTSTEDAVVTAAMLGNLFTVSGTVDIDGQQSIALNFDVAEKLIHRSTVANSQAEIEISVYNEPATGTPAGTLTPFNRNSDSDKTTNVVVHRVTTPTMNGNLVDFAVDRLGASIIAGVNDDFAVLIERRDQGATQTVKFAATFEILERVEPVTSLLTYNGEQLTYNSEDLVYVS